MGQRGSWTERTADVEASGQEGTGVDEKQEGQCRWSRETRENSTEALEGGGQGPTHAGGAMKFRV